MHVSYMYVPLHGVFSCSNFGKPVNSYRVNRE